jgi:hypothetical protein
MLIVTTTEADPHPRGGQVDGTVIRQCTEVCGTSDLEIGWGYVKQVEIVVLTARVIGSGLRPNKRPVSIRRR